MKDNMANRLQWLTQLDANTREFCSNHSTNLVELQKVIHNLEQLLNRNDLTEEEENILNNLQKFALENLNVQIFASLTELKNKTNDLLVNNQYTIQDLNIILQELEKIKLNGDKLSKENWMLLYKIQNYAGYHKTKPELDALKKKLEKLAKENIIVPIIFDNNKVGHIFQNGSRKFVIANCDTRKILFYCSTGLCPKDDYTPGNWYPVLGISPDGWINKTNSTSNYYGITILEDIAKVLNQEIGDIRGIHILEFRLTTKFTNSVISRNIAIITGLKPLPGYKSDGKLLYENIALLHRDLSHLKLTGRKVKI
jgi:hypothetical protein